MGQEMSTQKSVKQRFLETATVMGVIAALAACATPQVVEPLPADFDFGDQPENYDALIKGHFERVLKDPESARYTYEDGWLKVQCNGLTVRWQERQLDYAGWAKVVRVNAKNSYGGYVGDTRYIALFDQGQLQEVMENGPFAMKGCEVIERLP